MSTAVENVLKEDKNLSEGDIANIAKFINDFNFELIEKYGVGFKPSNLKLISNGPLEAISIPLNYKDGDTFSLAVAKAIVGFSIGVAVGAVVGTSLIAVAGTALAFGYFFGDEINNAVEAGYNYIIGPDFEFNTRTNILEVYYTTYEALTATAGWWNNETLEQTIKKNNLSDWTLHSNHSYGGPDIEYIKSDNRFIVKIGLEQARNKSKDYIEALFEFSGDSEFKLGVNDGTYNVLNLKNRSQGEIYSLLTSNDAVAYAVMNLQSYAVEGYDSFTLDKNYSDMQKEDLSAMLYYHLNPGGGEGRVYANLITRERVFENGLGAIHKSVFGTNSSDNMAGYMGDDRLYGNGGSDILDGYIGDDYLDGGEGADTLKGGDGYDTYIANDGDTIRDSDHQGSVEFDGITLDGGKWDSEKEIYINETNNITYSLEDSTLKVSGKSGTITINDYDKEKKSLGIELEKSVDIKVSIADVTVNEADGLATLTVTIDEKLDEDLTLIINTSDGSATSDDYETLSQYKLTIPAGEKEATLDIEIKDDDEAEESENFKVEAVDKQYDGEDLNDIDYGEGGTVTIEDDDEEDIVKITVKDIVKREGDSPDQFTEITVTIDKELNENLTINTSIGSTTIVAGLTEGKIKYSWAGDTLEEADIHKSISIDIPSGDYTIKSKSDPSEKIKVKEFKTSSGSLTIEDDDDECTSPDDCDPDPRDPLVLDTNKDGNISIISLEDSNAYFDLTGDEKKEKVAWVKGEDAFLVYDENENGQIDGINEVFGNAKLSGFSELKNKIDSNNDGKIDRKDELYYQLQTWHDYNGDGDVDDGELKSLKEEGVVSINTEVFNTNIEVDGNILTESSKYTDTKGNLELAADLLLQYEGSIFEDTDEKSLGIEIKEEVKNLPNLKARGYVLDSMYAYSSDEKLLNMAQEFSTDIGKIANNFDEFLAQWSGFYDMAAKKSIEKEEFSVNTERNLPIKLWILEKFMGFRRDSYRTESHLGSNQNGNYHNQRFGNPNYVQEHYSKLINKYESLFAIQTVYKDIFVDIVELNQQYDYAIINNPDVLIHRISKYINDSSIGLDKRLYLASIIKKQENWTSNVGLGFDFEAVESKITDSYIQDLVSQIFNDEVNLLIKTDETTFFENDALIIGTNEDDLIETTKNFSYQNNKATIIAGNGYDRIITVSGDTKYIYNLGDGIDIIYDKGGDDTLQFNDIYEEDIEIQKLNNDLIIGIKEDGVSFNDLSNKIIIKDFMKVENQIENIIFKDGSSLNILLALEDQLYTESDDYIDLSNSDLSLNIDAKAGDDTVITGNYNDTLIGSLGDDTLKGGKGNDTYIFNKGDGKDTIIDSSGVDILKFTNGIEESDIQVKIVDKDIIVAIKEDGKLFEELGDKVIISNFLSSSLKTIELSNGSTFDIESLQNVSNQNDTLIFTKGSLTIDSLEGDDNITTSSGDDTISGNSGNDTIFTSGGNDTLIGGKGEDTLLGGLGDDTYVFNRGDGKDIIDDSFYYGYNLRISKNSGNDSLRFAEGITKEDIEIKIDGNDVIIALKEDGKSFDEYSDSITIKNGVNIDNRIENILLSDGSKIFLEELQSITEDADILVFDNKDTMVDSLGGDDSIITGSGNDTIRGNSGNDTITSNSGDDILYGGAGNDTVYAGNGNDYIDSGSGDDNLQGELGDDTYIFNLGDGVDTVYDYYRYGSAGNDTIKFGDGISLEDISAIADGDNLIISYSEVDKVIIKNWQNINTKIETIKLNDGTLVSIKEIQKATKDDDNLVYDDTSINIDALAGDDSIISGKGDDTIYGNEGNDTIKSGDGNDILFGGAGDDTIYAEAGDDILQGDSGRDELFGGAGDDTYIFSIGNGIDIIYDEYKDRYRRPQNAGNDTIKFGEGITQDNLIAVASGNDMIIAIKEEGKVFDELTDKIIIKDWLNINNKIENIILFDGTSISIESIQQGTLGDDYLVFDDSGVNIDSLAGDDTIVSGAGDDTIDGNIGNDIIKSGYGNDNVSGGEGNDSIDTSNGNDIITGGLDNDTLAGGLGDDIYIFNKGDGKDIITDIGGVDIIQFTEGIIYDDLIFKRINDDLIIAIDEQNISYENLKDKITINNWFNSSSNIEKIEFNDGSILTSAQIAQEFTQDGLSGNIHSRIGATLIGEAGDDTYVYQKGHYTVIIDDKAYETGVELNAGYDKLLLSGGINKDNITIGVNGSNLIININSNTYDELSDRVVVRDWQNINKGIEEIIFTNGESLLIDRNEIFPEVNYSDSWLTKDIDVYGEENNIIETGNEDNEIYSGQGDDIVNSGLGNDIIDGGAGNDTINSGEGNDTLDGGAGDDQLNGSRGDDVYIFGKGYGKDNIYDKFYMQDAGNDVIQFREGITVDDLIFMQNDNDLIIAIKEDGKTFSELTDKITVMNWNDRYNSIETLKFSDGTEVLRDEILPLMIASNDDVINTLSEANQLLYGKEGNDTITTQTGNDVIYAGSGDDIIKSDSGDNIVYGGIGADNINLGYGNDEVYGEEENDLVYAGNGNDRLYGGKGDDELYGEYGNDALDGGEGNDLLSGKENDDTYLFGIGDGSDTIIEYNGTYINSHYVSNLGNDTIEFKENITITDLIFMQKNSDLIIAIKEDTKEFEELSDKLIIKNFTNAKFSIENFLFSNGETLTKEDILPLIITTNDDNILGGSEDETINGGLGDDILNGGAGDDIYTFARGDGKDIVSDFMDFYGDGNSIYDGGNDTIQFSEGIMADDLIFVRDDNDLIIGIKEDGKSFEELSDIIILDSFFLSSIYRIEKIEFISDSENNIDDLPLLILTKATENDDILEYTNDDDTVDALAGNDIIYTYDGNDTIDGGRGDDTINGGSGDDTYLFGVGSGKDTISDVKVSYGRNYSGGNDTIQLKEGITIDDLIFMQKDNNLIIAIKEDDKIFEELSDKLILTNWQDVNYRIENIKFWDDTLLNVEDIQALIDASSDNIIYGTEFDDSLYSEDAENNNLTFYGLEGNDEIYAGSGDDILNGGVGNDYLEGQEGSDIYVFEKGFGEDTISDYVDNSDVNIIKFGEGIYKDNLIFTNIDNENLEITFNVDGMETDKLIIEGFYYDFSIGKIEFISDYINNIDDFISFMLEKPATSEDDILVYTDKDNSDNVNIVDGLEGDDEIYTNSGDDILNGGLGDDYLVGGKGSDSYIFEVGSGHDIICDEGDISSIDKIRFGEGILKDHLIFEYYFGDLKISFSKEGMENDTLIIENFYDSFMQENKIEKIEFLSDSTNNIDNLISYILEIPTTNGDDIVEYIDKENSDNINIIDGLDGNDMIFTHSGNDILNGNNGDDELYSGDGDDVLYGGNGEDSLFADNGNDILEGGLDDDYLYGEKGDDTYVFSRGDGLDLIVDEYHIESDNGDIYFDGGNDTILFSEGIILNDLIFQLEGIDLVIGLKEDGVAFENLSDKITIANWQDANYRIENIKFSDGTLLTFIDDQANYTLTEPTESSTPPIVLDMNFNGTTSISLGNSNAYFDYAADGKKEHTSWIESGDALLVADLNNDGIINDGSELFGNYTKLANGTLANDGYEALAQYDSNSDLIIDYKDDKYSKLSLWNDLNQNGKTDAGELQNIQLSVVTAIHLTNSDNTIFEQVTENGNLITNETEYETNSENGKVRDIWFEYDETNYITNNDTLQATDTQKYLSLKDGNDTYIYSLGDGLVTIDDAGNGEDTLKFTQGIKKEQIEVSWNKNTDDIILSIRPTIDDTTAVTELENQILIKNWFNDTGSIEMIQFSDGTILNKEQLFEILTSKKETSSIITRVFTENGQLEGGIFNDVLYGSSGSELLDGKDGHDYLKGLEGDDQLTGGYGDDTHFAGLGNDLSTDIDGDEYYIYNRGDGQDTIIDANGNDTIVFGADIVNDDLIIKEIEDTLVIALKEDGVDFEQLQDTITIENYSNDNYKIENLEFSNGEIVSLDGSSNSTTDKQIVLDNIEVTLQEDNIISGGLQIDGNTDGIQFTVESVLENSNLQIDELGNYTYTPNQDYNGIEQISVSVINKYGETSFATLTFIVEAVNDTPIAKEDIAEVVENGTLTIQSIDILSNDIDVDTNDILTITNVSGTENKGVVSLVDGNVVFETGTAFDYLAEGESEVVILNYEMQDDKGASSSSTISVTVTGANDAPIISIIDEMNTQEDSNIITGQIVATDVDNNSNLIFTTTEIIAGFTLNEDGSYSFNPSSEEYQTLSQGDEKEIIIPITVTDENGSADIKDLIIKVIGTNDTPIAKEDTAEVIENGTLTIQSIDILSNDVDVDTNDILTITNVEAAAENKGIASLIDGNVVFETGTAFDYLSEGESEVVILNYEMQDDIGANSSSTISVTVTGTNDAPIVNFPLEEITLTQELTKNGQIQASDIDDDVLTYTIVENAKHGEFKVDENGMWKYNVDSTYSGEDSVIVQIDDLNGGIVTKTLNFNVDNNVKNGDDRTNFLFGNNEKNILNGLGGNDFIFALRGDDMILGGEGNDIIFAAQGDDMIWGDKGDDILDGHTGNDTYIFNIGDGNDTIFEYKSRNSSDINRILLGENITAENIKFVKDNNNLIIKVSENDSIKIMNWYTNQDNISEIIFDDGTKLLNNEILEKVALEGTSRKDTLRGTNTEDNMYALEGDDRVYGYGGNDLLNGGKGDDYLRGGDGDDIYSFSLGDGNDTIVEEGNIFNWNNDNKNDTVQFDNTISATDILFTWDRNNLIINYSDNDSIKIDNQKRGYKDIENFKLSDGSYLTNDDVEILIQNMISFADENDIDLTNRNEVKNNSELMNIVTNAWHHAS